MQLLIGRWQLLNAAALAFGIWQAVTWLTASNRPSGSGALVAAAAVGTLCVWWSVAYRAAARGERGAVAGLAVLAFGWGFLANGVCGLAGCAGLPEAPYAENLVTLGNLLWGGLASLANVAALRRAGRAGQGRSALLAAMLVGAAFAARSLA